MSYSVQIIGRVQQPKLWHLSAEYTGGAHFLQAWDPSSNRGVTVSVVDEGVNHRHSDLAHAYDTSRDFDPRDARHSDAAPDDATQTHGTRVAGLLVGDINNDLGTVGGALGSTVTASYLRFGQLFDFGELDRVLAHQQTYDVSNNSWGFTAAFADNFGQARFQATAAALEAAATEGRGGLGTAMVFAAGNGKLETSRGNVGDDANFHNLTNSRFSIAVGAHDAQGAPAFFSNPGTNLLLTAPGSGLLTTDGIVAGSEASTYVSGTSFAAPLVSSAIALMLAENPDLGYRDIQEILALSAAARTDGGSAENGFDGFNGGGLMFDREGGFGRLDAAAAVALARNWTKVSTADNQQELELSFQPGSFPKGGRAVFETELAPSADRGFSLEWVEIELKLRDSNLKDLRIELVSPEGTRAVIAENLAAAGGRTSLSFTFSSVMTWGENPYGTWRLELSHAGAPVDFSVYTADLRLFGAADTKNDTYHYTSSFAALAAQDSDRTRATDTDGGEDTLDFAAGGTAVSVDLSGRTATRFQGVEIDLEGEFENAVGTVHGDRLVGSAHANRLVGDFGDDTIGGGAGEDHLEGGRGRDLLDGGAGRDTMRGGEGDDVYLVDHAGDVVKEARAEGAADEVRTSLASYSLAALAEVENLSGTASTGQSLMGNKLANVIGSGRGDDRLNGGAGADTLSGGEGDDVYYVDSAADVVNEAANAAGGLRDQVVASTSYTLGAGQGVEVLTAAGNAGGLALTGNERANTLYGNAAADTLNGAGGDDVLSGSAGRDWLNGGSGQDSLNGGAGHDTISGGAGKDVLTGLGGNDTFLFDTALGAANVDRIVDFSVADDSFLLDHAVFTALRAGTLDEEAFATGSRAAEADDRIVYNAASGALLYDADGSGSGGAFQFAVVRAGLALTHDDFMIA